MPMAIYIYMAMACHRPNQSEVVTCVLTCDFADV